MATDSLVAMETAMARDGIHTNDRQLACARINSKEGQDYLVRNLLTLAADNPCAFMFSRAYAMPVGCYGMRSELRVGQP